MGLLEETVAKIEKLDQEKMNQAQERLDSLTKPPGSLGKLEEIAVKLAGITGELFPKVDHKAHIVMAADHGVVAEGVSAFPQEVTTQMVYNFLNGGAAVNVLAKQMAAEVTIVDIGVVNELEAENLVIKKVKAGTDNLAQGSAMSRQEARAALEVGIEVGKDLISQGANLIGTGEMGIGNTTASSAILATITDLSLDEIVGYGTGIDEAGLKKKKQVITQSLAVNQPQVDDGIDILAKVGGLEIAGMAGVMLVAAANRVPVIVDGLISGAAALIAKKLKPQVTGYLISSHKSVEPGHIKIYDLLGLKPLLDLDMRLGEGTGAVLSMNLVEAATKIISDMATFEEAQIIIE
ncbi:nicotinate-nucleotide--dimethylbenzimidazole phosphoribosyltransferase [Halobacteroides halobius DSM 5150]|uniref:Nicotinate-nucleotide--dimethylbenzimidazole phosphoribosyltransferase n=1 Tax=Halobacteroides halobius (strain ATCC 35273 / DSM 5150 / MD-1) TaxID=748449 RepID=L0K9F3_HALHC|nr:nicotinate-nucleotide--dimethylbenzimidazole phosphoribosyltransferase [Halobacteroides halobius]AGB41646.1 nicotinate-nucleotide--dimethylbenzimidazole phosphoribosyltransferase [Halobacteroides halobius DSM 5150]